jgi:hypothetical protein
MLHARHGFGGKLTIIGYYVPIGAPIRIFGGGGFIIFPLDRN